MTTRAEHLAWSKTRALEYLDLGRPDQAVASLLSDLNKEPETAKLLTRNRVTMLTSLVVTDDRSALRRLIEGLE